MNPAQREDWLQAVSDSLAKWRLGELTKLLARLDAAGPGGFWEGGVSGRSDAKRLALRYFGEPRGFSKWRGAAGEILGVPAGAACVPPADGFPWMSVVWNAAAGRLESAAALSRADAPRGAPASPHWSLTRVAGEKKLRTELLKPGAYSPRTIGDAGLAQALDSFAAHCPVRDLVYRFSVAASGESRPVPSWALRLKEAVAWPRFLRLDLAASFAPESSLLSFLLLDRRVSELAFEGETLWAYFRA